MDETNSKTYRFNFSNDFIQIIHDFSKIHQYEARVDFKESFTTWVSENQDIIDNEVLYLETKGYVGDIKSKIYKSARYYFRTKPTPPPTNKPVVQIRKRYIGNSNGFIQLIDQHASRFSTIKPEISFNTFIELYSDDITEEITTLRQHSEFTELTKDEIITTKIKKTFKNRYFLKNSK
jgi:hypothetical protein